MAGGYPTRSVAITEGQGAGHDFDRLAVADIGEPYAVTTDGTVIAGPALVKGFITISGTNPKIALKNGGSSGATIYPQAASAHTIGSVVEFPAWVLFDTDVYADVDGTEPVFRLIAVAVGS